MRPYSQLSPFWRYWLYYLNPSTYWIGGVLSATLPSIPVSCLPTEAARFNPPPGQTCAQYAAAFVSTVAHQGYLMNPQATSDCGYCPYSTGAEYLRTLNVRPEDKWRDLGIFAAFCVSNWALVYFFIYTVRVRGWSFGLRSVFGGLGRMVGVAKGLVMKVGRKRGGR